MATTTCIIKTAALIAGETFILPPGAILISATDPLAITSSCGAVSLETAESYVFVLAGYDNTNGDGEYFEKGLSEAYGYTLYGVTTNFAVAPTNNFSQGTWDYDSIRNTLAASIPAITATAGNSIAQGAPNHNTISYVVISTVPSIANTLRLLISTSAPVGGGTHEVVKYEVPLVKYADAVTTGYVGMPADPLIIP